MLLVDFRQSTTTPRCPSCRSPQTARLPYRGGAFDAYQLYTCVECDLVFRDKKPILPNESSLPLRTTLG
jgi:transposase-like protein